MPHDSGSSRGSCSSHPAAVCVCVVCPCAAVSVGGGEVSAAVELREAAELMRERAEAAAMPWHPWGDESLPLRSGTEAWRADMDGHLGGEWGIHAASWHPVAALAVADWLDMCAGMVANYGPNADSPWVKPHTDMALAVARAYLGVSL